MPNHGYLAEWSSQGGHHVAFLLDSRESNVLIMIEVLMLNTTLTVRQGEPNSHAKRGYKSICNSNKTCHHSANARVRWEEFTDAVIREIAKKEGIVFLLWGKPAQNK